MLSQLDAEEGKMVPCLKLNGRCLFVSVQPNVEKSGTQPMYCRSIFWKWRRQCVSVRLKPRDASRREFEPEGGKKLCSSNGNGRHVFYAYFRSFCRKRRKSWHRELCKEVDDK